MRTTAWLLVMVFTTLGAGCLGSDDHGLAAARARWKSHLATDYALTWHQACFCPIESVRPIRFTVVAGEVKSATYVEDGEPVSDLIRPLLKTIDGVFDQIQSEIDRHEVRVSVAYDPTWSYPSSFAVDYGPQASDGGYSLLLSDFVPFAK